MRLTPDWRAILRHAWSVRLMILAALLQGAEVALPLLGNFLPIPPGAFALLSFVTVSAAFAARFVAQRQISPPAPPEDDDHEHA